MQEHRTQWNHMNNPEATEEAVDSARSMPLALISTSASKVPRISLPCDRSEVSESA